MSTHIHTPHNASAQVESAGRLVFLGGTAEERGRGRECNDIIIIECDDDNTNLNNNDINNDND